MIDLKKPRTNTALLAAWVRPHILEAIQNRAKSEGVSVSEMLRRAVDQYLNHTNGHQGVTQQARKTKR